MSRSHELRVLELSSQATLLERMQLLASFGSNLIHVSGERGAGKTWIAQRYLEAWAENKNQALLMCYHNQSDAQRRHTILSQLRSNISFNPDANLADSFHELMEGQSCNVVIVVDDAQLLSEALISELWMLVAEAQVQSKWSIAVILFTLPTILDKQLTRLSYGQEQKSIDLEIETLPIDDADRLFEFSVMRFVDDEMERRVRIAYSKVKKIPGEIMALGEQKMEKRIIIRSIVGSPINIIIVVALLVLAISGGYWLFYEQISMPDDSTQTSQPNQTSHGDSLAKNVGQDQTAIPTLSTDTNSVTANSGPPSGQASTNGIQADVKVDPNASDDSNSLPPSIVSTTDNVGTDDTTHQRVVITSEVVDALLDGDTTSSESIDAASLTSGLMTSTPTNSTSPTTNKNVVNSGNATVAQAEQLSQATSEPMVVAPNAASRPAATARLLAMSERSYTLQLAAFNTQNDVDDFIRQNDLGTKANVYQTVRQGVAWFIITYDNFSTLQLARDAIETLPRPVQDLGPWAKSLRQVHREIELVK